MATNNAINNTIDPLDLTAVKIDPGASGDSYVQFDINTTGEFRIGVDDDAGDAFKISQGSALGTNDTFTMTSAGELTMPLLPAFLAYMNSTVTNVTGDGTEYAIAWDSEAFDQNSDFSSTTFTAPVTGKYLLSSVVSCGDLSGSFVSSQIRINTSNRLYVGGFQSDAARDSSDQFSSNNVVLGDMDAADIATISIIWGGSTKTVDVLGSVNSYFSGYLAC